MLKINKRLLALAFTIFGLLPALAKGNAASGSLGPNTRLGICFNPLLSFSRAPGLQTDNKGVKGGFSGGLMFDHYFAPNYGISAGLYFTYAGSNLIYHLSDKDTAGHDVPATYAHKYTTQYIEIPIGFKFRTNEINRITYYGEMGITPMILVAARANLNPDFDGTVKSQVKVYNTRVNPIDLAAHFGAGIEYNISGSTSLVAGILYKYAFLNQIKDHKVYTNKGLLEDKIFLNYVSLRVGVLF